MLRLAIVLAVVSVLVSGCKEPVTQSEVAGMYKANFGSGTNEIAIASNGTYVKTIHRFGHDRLILTNKCEFEIINGEPWLSFYGFSENPAIAVSPSAPVWGVEVERSRGSLKLVVSYDRNEYYLKK